MVQALQMAAMFLVTLYSWLIFRCESLSQLIAMTRGLLRFSADAAWISGLGKIAVYGAVLVAMQLAQFRWRDPDLMRRWPAPVQAAFYLMLFYLIMVFGVFDSRSFIYFQF